MTTNYVPIQQNLKQRIIIEKYDKLDLRHRRMRYDGTIIWYRNGDKIAHQYYFLTDPLPSFRLDVPNTEFHKDYILSFHKKYGFNVKLKPITHVWRPGIELLELIEE